MTRLDFISVLSEEEFLRAQADGDFNTGLVYEEYVAGCHRLDAFAKKQRAAMDPFDRAIIEAREADFRRRRQARAA